MKHRFTSPTSIAEAELRQSDAVARLQDVEFQLSARKVAFESGQILDAAWYHQWRVGKLATKTQALAECRALKDWLRQQRGANGIAKARMADPQTDALFRAFALLRRLRGRVAFLEEEQSEFDSVAHFLEHERKTPSAVKDLPREGQQEHQQAGEERQPADLSGLRLVEVQVGNQADNRDEQRQVDGHGDHPTPNGGAR